MKKGTGVFPVPFFCATGRTGGNFCLAPENEKVNPNSDLNF
jgi:hypothetical protein